jgi:RNA polymerase sigma-70 factor (ECF subfamily)
VQDTLARAFYALSMTPEVPNLRPWLFRIAHNAALDYLKSHGKKLTEASDAIDDLAGADDQADPEVVRAAIARFLTLPVQQRSAVILKDVLDHSLEETAETMGTTVLAVKAALVRGRAKLREEARAATAPSPEALDALRRYASLFNARDWDGVRALVADDCRLDVVSRSLRRGREVRYYFERYAQEHVRFRVVMLEGRLALAADAEGAMPPYFVLLGVAEGRVTSIRDFRYVPYIAVEADVESVDEPA